MVDRSPDVAGASPTHILSESECHAWKHALFTAAEVFERKAKDLRNTIYAHPGEPAIERIAASLDVQANAARQAAALLAEADRVEIFRGAPEGGAA